MRGVNVIEKNFSDSTKFSKLDIPAGKEVNHNINLGKTIISKLKLLKT